MFDCSGTSGNKMVQTYDILIAITTIVVTKTVFNLLIYIYCNTNSILG